MVGGTGRVVWIDRHPGQSLAGVLLFYLVVVLSQASLKLIWADELFTYYIAQQPGLGGVWHALAAGADPNPPVSHLLVKASTTLLGAGALAIRLPSILCMMAAIYASWWMLRRWVRPVYALVGVLAFMSTRGFDYAYDARSYAPLLGLSMASLALWICSDDRKGWRQKASLVAMALALAGALSSNYYGVLAFFPISAGEAFRSTRERRFRAGVWIALAAASLPLLAYLPLIRHNIAEFGPHAWNRPRVSMIGLSYVELVEGVFWPLMALAFFAIWKQPPVWRRISCEMLALGVLMLYPLLGFAIALGGAGMISPRCVVPVCCGFGMAMGVLAQRVFGDSRRAATATVCLFLVWVGVRESFCASLLLEQRRNFFALRQSVMEKSGQVLVADSSFVLPLYFYSDTDDRRRIVCPVDFAAIHLFEPDDSGEQNLWAGRDGVFPFPIVTLDSLRFGGSFVVVGRPHGWLVQSLKERQVRLDGAVEDTRWYGLGGVFTPMAHPETRLMRASTE